MKHKARKLHVDKSLKQARSTDPRDDFPGSNVHLVEFYDMRPISLDLWLSRFIRKFPSAEPPPAPPPPPRADWVQQAELPGVRKQSDSASESTRVVMTTPDTVLEPATTVPTSSVTPPGTTQQGYLDMQAAIAQPSRTMHFELSHDESRRQR